MSGRRADSRDCHRFLTTIRPSRLAFAAKISIVARRNRKAALDKARPVAQDLRTPDFEDKDVRVIASSIRKGNIIEREDGQLCVVLSAESFHPGKGTPTTQIDMRRLSDGVKVTDRFKTTEQVERAFVEDKNFDFLYSDGDGYHFMNAETYDQITVPADVIGDQAQWLQEGMKVILSIFNETPVGDPVAAARDAGSRRDGAGDEGPDRLLVLQAGQAFERRARHGAAPHQPGNANRHPDRGRQLRRARERLSQCRNEGGAGGLEFVEVRDHPVRAKLGHGDVGIAEIDCDHRKAGSAGGLDVGDRVADHDRPVAHPAGRRDRAEQGLRIGLADAERVLAADEGEPFRHAQLLHEELRRAFHLVGADGLTPAGLQQTPSSAASTPG